ncbi:MAG: NUDIX domain-containing protein [Crocinitomicaceae bacterium]|nr:NUDIX domain-containing protein [Flavobacteriales bacterium]NQZ36527.1 NUDIX domain-containing protein [Crocinitomicaceae bacterium]
MYKVFVDHKPVIFIESKDVVKKQPSIKASEIVSFPKGIRLLLRTQASIDSPLQIICDDPKESFKEFFSDFIKIKAAGGLVQRKELFLMIKRKGLWDIPKGKIEKKEDKEVAAVREVMEECGIEGHKIKVPLVVTYHTMKFKGRWALKRTDWFMMKYKGPRALTPQLNEGITKVKWMTEEHMLSIRGRTYGSINEVLDAYVRSKS